MEKQTTLREDLTEMKILADLVYHGIIGCLEYEAQNNEKRTKECFDLLLTRMARLTFKGAEITDKHDL